MCVEGGCGGFAGQGSFVVVASGVLGEVVKDFDILADLSANGFMTREQFVRKMDAMWVRWVVFNPTYDRGPVMTSSEGRLI